MALLGPIVCSRDFSWQMKGCTYAQQYDITLFNFQLYWNGVEIYNINNNNNKNNNDNNNNQQEQQPITITTTITTTIITIFNSNVIENATL